MGVITAMNCATRQVKIADRIKHLMPHEFVRRLQAGRIKHPVAIHYQGIVQAAATRQTGLAQRLDLVRHGERARTGQLHAPGHGVGR